MENRCVMEVIFLTRGRCEISSAIHEHGLRYGKNKLYRRDSRPDSSRKVESDADAKLRCSEGELSSIQCWIVLMKSFVRDCVSISFLGGHSHGFCSARRTERWVNFTR